MFSIETFKFPVETAEFRVKTVIKIKKQAEFVKKIILISITRVLNELFSFFLLFVFFLFFFLHRLFNLVFSSMFDTNDDEIINDDDEIFIKSDDEILRNR